MAKREIIIKDTHRGLKYQDGVLVGILEAGRYELPDIKNQGWFSQRQPQV